MSVWKFSRTTSCRPCLMSSIALSYRILSCSAVFYALVDLLTLFFLWKICASHRVALSRNSPVTSNRAGRLAAARKEVRSKLHLSLESGVPRRGLPEPWLLPDYPRFEAPNYTLNEWPGRTTTLPLRPAPSRAHLVVMPPRSTKGCPRALAPFELFQPAVTIACRFLHYNAIIRKPAVRNCGLSKWTNVTFSSSRSLVSSVTSPGRC